MANQGRTILFSNKSIPKPGLIWKRHKKVITCHSRFSPTDKTPTMVHFMLFLDVGVGHKARQYNAILRNIFLPIQSTIHDLCVKSAARLRAGVTFARMISTKSWRPSFMLGKGKGRLPRKRTMLKSGQFPLHKLESKSSKNLNSKMTMFFLLFRPLSCGHSIVGALPNAAAATPRR